MDLASRSVEPFPVHHRLVHALERAAENNNGREKLECLIETIAFGERFPKKRTGRTYYWASLHAWSRNCSHACEQPM